MSKIFRVHFSDGSKKDFVADSSDDARKRAAPHAKEHGLIVKKCKQVKESA